MSYTSKYIEKCVDEFIESNQLKKPFYKAGEINPLKIFGISNALPKMNLSHEEILFCFDKRENGLFKGFVLTDFKLHYILQDKPEVCSLEDIKSITKENIQDILSPDYTILTDSLYALFQKIANADHFVEKEQFFANDYKKQKPKTMKNENQILTDDFLALVLDEGNKISEILEKLNADTKFLEVLQASLTKSDALTNEFKPNHVALQDIIFLFNKLFEVANDIPIRAKFILAYLFERLQGKDMLETIEPERLEKMLSNEKFLQSVETVRKAQFLKTTAEYKNQLILTSILSRVSNAQFEPLAGFYYSLATLFLNTDEELNDEEKKELDAIHQLCFQPKRNIDGVRQSEVPDGDTLEKVMAEMNELIGLKNIKTDINDLINYLKVQKLREAQQLKVSDRMLHAVFMGPPGTGKTTIARLLGRIYKHLGYLKSGHLVETDRAGMVAGYVGQTAIKVDEIIKAALDGVLFIDEAYALAKDDSGRDFGHEAIETLLKRMEDHRDDLVVIAAGYPDEMKEFIQSNPGLQSRFNRYFNFEHYTAAEMLEIFNLNAKKADYVVTEAASKKLSLIFEGLYAKRNKTFGNARVVRNIFEQCIANQANRIIQLNEITKELLMTLEDADIPNVEETIKQVFVFQN